jgi:GTP-binding protein HflX
VPEKVIAVGLILPAVSRHVVDEHLDELEKLIETAGGCVVDRVIAKRTSPDSATWIGKGKAEQVKALVERDSAALVVFDDDLSPAQTRNLERIIPAKVIDRSGLILDIFARRARSRESRTQVELAQLEYMLPRLTRQWSHLSRQAGGIGTRGVGETQLEIDRRIVRNRISRLKSDLERIEQARETQRKSRGAIFTVALVGYTNAGKSTLFNQLTSGEAVAVDKLFATLDAKSQRATFPMPRPTVIIDTVGFIRKLPHHLVASFRSTMEEAVSADLVLHVIDLSHPQYEEQRAIGEEVLRDLGVPTDRVIEVYNKVDRVEGFRSLEVARSRRAPPDRETAKHRPLSTPISALNAHGIDRLIETIRDRELRGGEIMELEIPHAQSRLLARLHEVAEIHGQRTTDNGQRISAWVPQTSIHEFLNFSAPDLLKRVKVS